MTSELHNQLQQSILSAQLSPESLAKVLALGQAIQQPPGTWLFREGEEQPHVYFLLSGRVDLSMTVPGRGTQRVLTLGPGEMIAWSAVVGNGTMTCSAVCLDQCRLVAVRAQQIEAAIAEDSKFGFEFMKMMAVALSQRLLATRLQLLDLFHA